MSAGADRAGLPEVRPEDLFGGALCTIAAVVVAIESVPSYFGRQGIGSGAFPTWVAVLLLCCGVGLLVQLARQRALAARADWPRGPALRRVLLAAASLAVYLVVLRALGFWLTSSLLLLFHFRVLGHYSWRVAVPMAIAAALIVTYVFGELLFMPLPPGLIGI